MGYAEAMKAAGAAVLVFQHFGSYQGDWLALCFYKGDFVWVHGCFGSCSSCDAFEAEFGDISKYDEPVKYAQRLTEFGREYLEEHVVDEAQIGRWQERVDWDSETASMLKLIASYKLDEEGKNELTKQLLMSKGD